MSIALLWILLLALLVLVLWLAYLQPPQATLEHQLQRSGFQGHTIPFLLKAKVQSWLPVRIVIDAPTPMGMVANQPAILGQFMLGQWQCEHQTTLKLNKRGQHHWPEATLFWADPLGLFWRSQPLKTSTQFEVYPATHPVLLPDLLRPLLSDGALSRTLGLEDPISLRGGREYHTGDPPGRIHWRMTARTGQLTVRELERTAASNVTLYIDTANAKEVFVESAVRLAASLLIEALNMNLPISVATNQQATPTGRGQQAHHLALSALSKLQPSTKAPHIPNTASGGNLFIVTSNASPELIEQAMLARASASRVIIVGLPEGFYLEPGENPRRQWVGLPDNVRKLEEQSGILAEQGILVYILRGNQSVLDLSCGA